MVTSVLSACSGLTSTSYRIGFAFFSLAIRMTKLQCPIDMGIGMNVGGGGGGGGGGAHASKKT